MYNSKVLDIFTKPQNMGKMHNSDAIGKAGVVEDGDVIKLYAKIENDTIVSATFETFGCVAAIACSAVVTDLLKDKTLEQALKLNDMDFVKVIDDLPAGKEHAITLALAAVADLVASYRKRLFKEGKITEEEFKGLGKVKNAKETKVNKEKEDKKPAKAKKAKAKKAATKKEKVEEKKEEVVEEVKASEPEVQENVVEQPQVEAPQQENTQVTTEEHKKEMRGLGNLIFLSKKITTTKTTTK